MSDRDDGRGFTEETSHTPMVRLTGDVQGPKRPCLVVIAGAHLGEIFPVEGEIIIGRELDAHLRLAEDEGVSRRHARVTPVADGALLSDLGSQNGRLNPGNLIEQEMPFVSREADVVTVFTGANDVNNITAALGNGAGGSDPAAYIDQKVATFAADYSTLINGIRGRATKSRIIVLNLPNMAALPFLATASLAQKQAAQRASVRMTTTAINTLQGVTVIDLLCDARMYQSSYYSSDGFHPNDAGYAFLGGEVARALTNSSYAAPRSSCPQMTLF